MIYGHGDDTYRFGDQVKHNFSSNIPTFADITPLTKHLATRLDRVCQYPEPQAHSLEFLIAKHIGVSPQHVMVTAGVTEAIYLIAQLYAGYDSIIPLPTYSDYQDASILFSAGGGSASPLHHLSDSPSTQRHIYWLCNPNNPTGITFPKPLLNQIVRQNPDNVYVVDQSFQLYTNMPTLQPSELVSQHNVILLHSLTKQYCIPGLRIGYITASPIIIDRLRQLRQPWTVSTLAIEAALFLIENNIDVLSDRQGYLQEAQRLHRELSAIPGINTLESHAHFMLCYLDHAQAPQLKRWLIHNYGILIRDASNFAGLSPQYFRVCTQTPDENDLLVKAITEFVNKQLKN